MHERVAFRAMSQFLTLGQWRDPENLAFVIRTYYEKVVHLLKPLVPKFRCNQSPRLKGL